VTITWTRKNHVLLPSAISKQKPSESKTTKTIQNRLTTSPNLPVVGIPIERAYQLTSRTMNKSGRYHVPDAIGDAVSGIPFQKRTSDSRVQVIGDTKEAGYGINIINLVGLKFGRKVMGVGSWMKWS